MQMTEAEQMQCNALMAKRCKGLEIMTQAREGTWKAVQHRQTNPRGQAENSQSKKHKFKQAGNRFFRCQVTDKQKTKSRMQAHAHMITLTIGQGMSGKWPVKYCRADEGNWKQERVGRVGLVTEGLMRRENRCVERRSSQGLRKGGEV